MLPVRSFSRSFSSAKKEVVILSAVRTPIGSFRGALKSFSGPQLGSITVKEAIKKAGIQAEDVQEVYLGNVVSAGLGQAPARQVALSAGLKPNVVCTTVNKVCSSGMKSIMLAASSIRLGENKVVVAGGFESMSNIPYYLLKARHGLNMGNDQLVDGMFKDGLLDAFSGEPMGICAEACAADHKITREEQDAYALESYRRAIEATKNGYFKDEIVAVQVDQGKGQNPIIVSEDEEPKNLKKDKVATLRPAFKKDGTVTAANASKLNDGASALIIADAEWAKERGLKPLAKILGYGDAEQEPIKFPVTPSLAIPVALKRAGVAAKDVSFYEINEAFSVVGLANGRLLNIDPSRLNAWGGGVALGHPIGSSGARIVTTLINVLKQNKSSIGVAGICNGGGGASSIVVERLN